MPVETFGAYELLARLAIGGMAEIWLARKRGEAGFEKELVLKRILPHYSQDEDFQRMFLDEARLAALLVHPNIVGVYDFGSADGLYFIAMEYVEGFDLRRVMRQAEIASTPIGVNRSTQIAHAMARGLGYAHTRSDRGEWLGIVHRDVSPHNVLVSMDGNVKVMDFGIAKASARVSKTRTGVVKGKLSYMSPEQARGEPVDMRSDIFSTGICLWEMIAGRKLFIGDSDIEILEKVKSQPIPSIGELAPDTQPALVACLERMLDRNKDARHQTMREVELELGRALHAMGGAFTAPLDELMQAVIPAEWRSRTSREARPDSGLDTRAKTRSDSVHTASGGTSEKTDSEGERAWVGETILAPPLSATRGGTQAPRTTAVQDRPATSAWLRKAAIGLAVAAAAVLIGAFARLGVLPPPPSEAPGAVPREVAREMAPAPSQEPTVAAAAPEPRSAPAAPTPDPKERERRQTSVPSDSRPAKRATAVVKFIGCPIGGVVYVDNRRVGELKDKSKELLLPIGRHFVEVTAPDGSRFAVRSVEVRPQFEGEYSCRD